MLRPAKWVLGKFPNVLFHCIFSRAFNMFVLLHKNHSAEPAINRFANQVFDHKMKKSTAAVIAHRLRAQPRDWGQSGAVSPRSSSDSTNPHIVQPSYRVT